MIDPKLKQNIYLLCEKVKEVLYNDDWPCEEGQLFDDGNVCSCPLLELVTNIEEGVANL